MFNKTGVQQDRERARERERERERRMRSTRLVYCRLSPLSVLPFIIPSVCLSVCLSLFVQRSSVCLYLSRTYIHANAVHTITKTPKPSTLHPKPQSRNPKP